MKKLSIISLILLIGIMYSCKKNDDPIINNVMPSTEDNKQKLEDTGIDLLNVIRDMENMETKDYMNSFTNCVDLDSPDNGNKSAIQNNAGIELLYNFKLFTSKQMSIVDFFSSMKGFNEKSLQTDSSSLQFQFNEVVGVYTWNFTTNTWDYSQTGNDIVFNFPSTETGTVNNAVITISYVGTEVNLPFDMEEEYTGDVPSSVTMTLAIDGVTKISYSLDCEYSTDGIPSSVTSLLTVSPYSFEVSADYSTSEVNVKYSLKEGAQIVLEFNAGVTGDFAATTFENAIIQDSSYWVDDYSGDTIWDHWTELDPDQADDILHNAHVSFQVFDIKLDGSVNAQDLANTLVTIAENNENGTITDEEATDQVIDAINDEIFLHVINTETNDIIAILEAYTYEDTYSYYEYIYNSNTGQYEDVLMTGTETQLGFNFIFVDGSSVDADVYFDDGFGSLVDQINDFLEELNAEYDLGAEPIEYSGTK